MLHLRAGSPPAIETAWCGTLSGAGAPIVTTTDGRANPIVWILGAEGDNRLHAFRGDTGEVLFTSKPLAGLRHFQTLIAALAAGLERHGGSLLLGNRVDRLAVDNGRVVGVQLAGGESLRASAVISNADGRSTYQSLLGLDRVPLRVARRLARLHPSLSAYILYAATSADLADRALASECIVYSGYDHDAGYRELLAAPLPPLPA